MLIYQLLRPITGYLSIQHPTKRIVDWVIPCFFALVFTLVIALFRERVNFFGAGGFISLVLGYVQNLPGFYIAALAAIATFARTDIDVLMPGNPPPKIRTEDNRGITNLVELTRRRFLCLLFAFLTAECIFLTFVSIVAISIAAGAKAALPAFLYLPAFYVTTFVYFLLLSQLLIATLWGLYYLGERIHQAAS
jgi:hypothetical protein